MMTGANSPTLVGRIALGLGAFPCACGEGDATGAGTGLYRGAHSSRDGEHTGAKPGRIVRGPGYRPAG